MDLSSDFLSNNMGLYKYLNRLGHDNFCDNSSHLIHDILNLVEKDVDQTDLGVQVEQVEHLELQLY